MEQEMSAVDLLEKLTELQAQIDVLKMNKADTLDKVIPPEVQDAIDAVNAEFDAQIEAANKRFSEIENAVKVAVSESGETVKGGAYQAVYNKGRVSWNTKQLEGLMIAFPRLAEARKEGNPYVTLRKVG